MRAMIASGSGRYADPWHPFPRTTPAVADVLREVGFEVIVEHDVDNAMTSLAGVDLLVVNAGDPWRATSATDAAPADAIEGFARALEQGIGILALHCAVLSLRDYPEWAPAIGAMWVPGLSHHPPFGHVEITGGLLPDATPVADFTVEDERYCRLQRIGRSTVVAQHRGVDSMEPTAWVRTAGASRVAVDVLGHDERSYESTGHRLLLQQLGRWASRSPG